MRDRDAWPMKRRPREGDRFLHTRPAAQGDGCNVTRCQADATVQLGWSVGPDHEPVAWQPYCARHAYPHTPRPTPPPGPTARTIPDWDDHSQLPADDPADHSQLTLGDLPGW